MVDIINGSTRSDQPLQAGKKIDMEEAAALLENGTFRLSILTQKMAGGIKTAKRMEHKFRERRLRPSVATVTADAAAGATAIAVDNPQYFHRDEVICSPSSEFECFIMNEDIGGTGTTGSITVLNKSGTGGITNAISQGAQLINLGESHAEGEAIPPAWNVKETEISTYLYQFDIVNQITDIEDAEENYGPSELAKRRKDFMIDQFQALDRMLYLGENNREVVSASGPRRHILRGYREWLETQSIDASSISGGITMHTLGLLIRPTKEYGSSSATKVGVCGQNAWSTISAFPDAFVQINPGKDQQWGITLKELNTPFGDIMISYNPLFSATYGLDGEMVILDPAYAGQLQMQTLPWTLKLNTGNSTDIHNITDVLTGTRGTFLKLPELHRRIYGIT